MKDGIFKLCPIHVSVIYQISWIQWILFHLGKLKWHGRWNCWDTETSQEHQPKTTSLNDTSNSQLTTTAIHPNTGTLSVNNDEADDQRDLNADKPTPNQESTEKTPSINDDSNGATQLTKSPTRILQQKLQVLTMIQTAETQLTKSR